MTETMLKVEKLESIEDGVHTGIIVALDERKEPYHYIDSFVQLEKPVVTLKYGCPANLKIGTKFYKHVSKFMELIEDKEYSLSDLKKALEGRKVQFQTISETNKDGTFARIVDGSIKPVN